MSKLLRTTRFIFALAVTLGLGFGATTAFAGTAASDCSVAPSIGACTSKEDCQTKCEAAGGSQGDCWDGCCLCAF
ncbi:MAG: hypothetical protein KY467_00545 [Gemmatimonadetes bacterium]|nr:hypothetical protein [Gemmatimonadota bacterium]